MSIVNKPNTFSANTTISSSEVNDNFDTLYNDYNGGISAANLATDSVTTAKIPDSNVTTAKIADLNVTTGKIADTGVTSAKLAEAFFRGRHQADTTNSAPTGLTVQFGWGFVEGTAADEVTETVTFPTTFSTIPLYIGVSSVGLINSLPNSLDDFTSETGSGPISATASEIVAASFKVQIARSDTVATGAGNYYGFTWLAIGAV